MADEFKRMRQIIGTAADWAANDIVIGSGELALEVDGQYVYGKVGDGTSTYSTLNYAFKHAVPDGTVDGQLLHWDEPTQRWKVAGGVVAVGGHLGVGTETPGNLVHVVAAGANMAIIRVSGTPDTTNTDWQIRSGDGQLTFRDIDASATRLGLGVGVMVGGGAAADMGVGTVNATMGFYEGGQKLHLITQAMYDSIIARLDALEGP